MTFQSTNEIPSWLLGVCFGFTPNKSPCRWMLLFDFLPAWLSLFSWWLAFLQSSLRGIPCSLFQDPWVEGILKLIFLCNLPNIIGILLKYSTWRTHFPVPWLIKTQSQKLGFNLKVRKAKQTTTSTSVRNGNPAPRNLRMRLCESCLLPFYNPL